MAKAKKQSFGAHLRKVGEGLDPVYVLVGTEPTLLSEAVTTLRDKTLTAAPDFNQDELRATTSGAAVQAVGAAGTLPMMAPKRWVHLADIHKLRAKDHDPILTYLDNPSPSTVFCLSGQKIDKRTKLGKKLSKVGGFFELSVPKPRDLPSWLVDRAKHKGFDVSHDAALLLADLVGADVGTLDQALAKAATYAGGTEVDTESVEATVVATRVHSIFDLTDAIGDRDLPKASMLLRNALSGGERALIILSMIARQLRQLIRAKEVGNAHPAQVARAIGVPPYLADTLAAQARRYSSTELRRGLTAAAEADAQLKSTRLSPGVVLDRLLVELMRVTA